MTTNNRGFTMIEMILSMTFVSFLMISIAMTSISMGRTYEKGLTLNQVNQAGRSIIRDMQESMRESSGQASARVLSTGGVICFGNTSYVYNIGSALAENSAPADLIKYSDTPNQPVRLAKVKDTGGQLCQLGPVTVSTANATELLPESDRGVAIQAIDPMSKIGTPLASAGTQKLYRIGFTLGTNAKALTPDGESCLAPDDVQSDEDYCAVNKFSFIARTMAGGN